ncbi:hypothetical protein CP8484711_2066, partial [Chlamydia psittaci 84-8471/1]
YKMPKL